MPDYNMLVALAWAQGMSLAPPQLPQSLSDVNKRAEFVETINQKMIGSLVLGQFSDQLRFRQSILESSKKFVSEALDDPARIATGLRLWAGCLDGAKTLSARTNDGPNTRESRAMGSASIGLLSTVDSVYMAGAETAPVWKRLIGQGEDLFWEGVPSGSPLLRYK